jgi:hypothetical protein
MFGCKSCEILKQQNDRLWALLNSARSITRDSVPTTLPDLSLLPPEKEEKCFRCKKTHTHAAKDDADFCPNVPARFHRSTEERMSLEVDE